jgi:hypothetical protein
VAETLGVSRSNLVERLARSAKPRRRHHKAKDAAVLPRVRRLVDARPAYGYRRITALLNRDLAAEGLAPANHKRIYRLMKVHGLLLEKHSGQRPGRSHDGKVVMMRSDLRWCSDEHAVGRRREQERPGLVAAGVDVVEQVARELGSLRTAVQQVVEALELVKDDEVGLERGNAVLGEKPPKLCDQPVTRLSHRQAGRGVGCPSGRHRVDLVGQTRLRDDPRARKRAPISSSISCLSTSDRARAQPASPDVT